MNQSGPTRHERSRLPNSYTTSGDTTSDIFNVGLDWQL